MMPLDLSVHPPRSPGHEIDGIAVLARTIDRARASLPGGNLGQYDPVGAGGLSNLLLHGLGIEPNDFVAVVAESKTEQDIVEWVRERSDVATRLALSARLRQMRLVDVPPERRAYIDAHYPQHIVARSETGFDLLDNDDRESFEQSTSERSC